MRDCKYMFVITCYSLDMVVFWGTLVGDDNCLYVVYLGTSITVY